MIEPKTPLPPKIIVTLTSYLPRFDGLSLVVDSLLAQTVSPDKIYLNIAVEDINNLPLSIFGKADKIFEVRVCDNIGSYKKIIPILKDHSADIIVTADDDVVYWSTWLEELIVSYQQDPNCVVGHRIHRVVLDECAMPIPYRDWKFCYAEEDADSPHALNFPTGVGGVLYPPNAFYKDVCKENLFLDLCPTGDDIWLYAMWRMRGGKAKSVAEKRTISNLPGSQDVALWHANIAKKNDLQISKMIAYYGNFFDKGERLFECRENSVAPFFSVIMPVYNRKAYVFDAIKSVLFQDFTDFELIVIDDGSNDGSFEIISAIRDPRLRLIRNEHLGGAAARNAGIDAANGEFIVWVDSDDLQTVGALAILYETIQSYPDADVYYGDLEVFYDHEAKENWYTDYPDYYGVSLLPYLIKGNCLPNPGTAVRKALYHVSGQYDIAFTRCHDYHMWTRLADSARFKKVPSVLCRWRQHGESLSSAKTRAFEAKVALDMLARYPVKRLFPDLENDSKGKAVALWRLSKTLEAWQEYAPAYQTAYKAFALGYGDKYRVEKLEQQAGSSYEPYFSIIVTTYNRPVLLKSALASLGEQSFKDFEVILVNDHGDPVESLLADYDFPITYIYQGKNQGLSAARNIGLKLATGRYIAYLDDDDIYLPSHIAVMAEAIERFPQSVIYTAAEYVSEKIEDGRRIELSRSMPLKHDAYDRNRLFVQNYIPVNTWAHPRSMLAAVGEFDTGLTAFEDWDMLLRLAARYPFVHVPEVTAQVHLRDAPNTGSDHMLGREQKNFGALYQEMYRRHSDLDSEAVRTGRRAMLRRFGVSDPSSSHQPASLKDWLNMRVLSPVQKRLVDERLEQNGNEPSFGVLLLDLEADRQKVLTTLASLSEPQNLYASIEPVVFTTNDSLAESFGGRIANVTKANWILRMNEFLATARFDWLVLVNAGDEFTSGGFLMAGLELLGAGSDFRAVYCDELYRQEDGALGAAFRPSMNLDYLLSFPAGMARHWIFRRETLVEAGGFDPAFSEALELELILRLINLGGLAGLGHVDEPLLITTPLELANVEDEQLAIIRHLDERGYREASIDSSLPGRYLIKYGHADKPPVSIMVPVEDQLPVLLRCVTSLMESTRYADYEILLLDGGGYSREVREWLAGIEAMAEQRIRVLRFAKGDSREAICNQAVQSARGDYLVLLSQSSAVVSEAWLDEMLNHALRPEVGIVGAELINKESAISHAGLILGLQGPVGRPFEGEPLSAAGYMQRLQVEQNYSAVSSDCLMIPKELWVALGGLDEGELSGTLAGVDLCLKAREAGFLTVWSPRVKMMIGRKPNTPCVAEADALYAKWLPLLARDPAYNSNLSLVQPGGFKLADTALSWRPLATWRPLPVVLAHPADQFGCGHYRVMQPFNAQQGAGLIDGALSMGLMHVSDLERYDPDVILLQRQISDERLEAMRRMKAFSRAFKVYELDDYLPNLPMKSAHKQHMPKDIVKSLRRGLSYVDRFVVSTEALADALVGFHDDIQVIENRLPPSWWRGLQSQRRVSERPRVGWAGGASHAGDLDLISDVVKALAGEVDWVFFGMCPEKIRPYVKEFHPGVEIGQYPAALARLNLDLALAPLEQNLFNECKSNLRLLEYGACGFPVVCSDVGSYRSGLPVTRVKNRFKDWVDAIRMHLDDLDAASRQGDELRSAVLKDWVLEGQRLTDWRNAWLPDPR